MGEAIPFPSVVLIVVAVMACITRVPGTSKKSTHTDKGLQSVVAHCAILCMWIITWKNP